jgi:hypothetical protein
VYEPGELRVRPSAERKAFNGLALAIVRTKRGARGSVVLTASADGLQSGRATINAR